ncbi:MAG: CBM9 family sugar-binding protein [Gammaproteobacteria bacterium]
MNLTRLITSLTVCAVLPACAFAQTPPTHYEGRTDYAAPRAAQAPTVDGIADEAIWDKAQWQPLTQRWLGPEYSAEDFNGRYKVVWTPERLYVLGEIVDDVLFDGHRDPLTQYWNDDCFEVFLDENFSGGDHQFNHNAFAYHVSLDNQAIDIGTDKKPRNYTHHVESRWQQKGGKIVWEVSIKVYNDQYVDGDNDNRPMTLTEGKVMGMMVAYCDNDGSEQRENFIGSEFAPGEDKNRGWIDAGLFGKLRLVGAR